VADIAVAINRVWNNEQNQRQEETTFVDITLWGRQAEIAQQYLTKGRGVFIEGRLQMDSWEDKASGQKRSKLKVVAENLQFMPDGKGNAGGGYSSGGGGSSAAPARSAGPSAMSGASADDSGFQEEDDIPF
jgi:single-strand DNA-binding protein